MRSRSDRVTECSLCFSGDITGGISSPVLQWSFSCNPMCTNIVDAHTSKVSLRLSQTQKLCRNFCLNIFAFQRNIMTLFFTSHLWAENEESHVLVRKELMTVVHVHLKELEKYAKISQIWSGPELMVRIPPEAIIKVGRCENKHDIS